MSQKIVGLEDVQPYKFSECSKADYIDALRMGHGLCLLNKPNEVRFRGCTFLLYLPLLSNTAQLIDRKYINTSSYPTITTVSLSQV